MTTKIESSGDEERSIELLTQHENNKGLCLVKKLVMKRFHNNVHELRKCPFYECYECDGYNYECPDYQDKR